MVNYSQSEENYLKAIFHLQQRTETISTNELATLLNTTPASVTDMLKKLSKKGLVKYRAYYGCSLTATGENVAVGIVRRHRLWEYFLSQKLGFNWEEVHDIAEELEHIGNEKLINKLDEFLGFPRIDPHGDPIPDANGKIVQPQKKLLAHLSENKTAAVTQIGNQSVQILELLDEKKITIGTKIKVLKRYSFDESMEIVTDNNHRAHITKELSQNIFIEN